MKRKGTDGKKSYLKNDDVRPYREKDVLKAINEIFRKRVHCKTEEELAATCLAVAEELTGSKFGFLGELNQDGRVDSIAISNPGWSACKMPDSEAVSLIRNMELRGIWSTAIKEGKSRIVNDPDSYPDRVGVPEGHPPITSFLGVPLKDAGKTFGLIALANKYGDRKGDGIMLDLPISRQTMAEMLGVSIETLMRALKRFRERRLITTARSRITLIDMESLQARAQTTPFYLSIVEETL